MADRMTFPATFKEFAEQYKIVDKEEVYTNGIELIPIFRVEQWLDNANIAILQAEIERLQKYNTDVDFKHYNDGKKDAAREIFEDVEKHLKNLGRTGYVGNMSGILANLKKKYESEGFIPAPDHTCHHIIPHTIESIADIAFQESEVVRCEDCKWWHSEECYFTKYCSLYVPSATEFCSHGERKSK